MDGNRFTLGHSCLFLDEISSEPATCADPNCQCGTGNITGDENPAESVS